MPTVEEILAQENLGEQSGSVSGLPIPDDTPPPEIKETLEPPKDWTNADEVNFQDWYSGWAQEAQLDPNPDAVEHQYDYRSAYKAGVIPEISQEDGRYHWPSVYKLAAHPNRFVDGIDTITGQPATIDQMLQAEQYKKKIPESQMAWHQAIARSLVGGALDSAEQYARAGRTLGLDFETQLQTLEQVKKGVTTPQEGIKGIVSDAVRSTVQSTAAGIPGALIGTIGGRLGQVGGFALSAGAVFTLAEYDRFMEEAEKAGLKREDVRDDAVVSALAEGLIEFGQDLLLGKVYGLFGGKEAAKTFKPAVKRTIMQGLRKFIKRTAVAAPVEAAGEMATDVTQTEAREKAGVPVEPVTVESLLRTGAVTVVQTLLMGGGASIIEHRAVNKAAEKYEEGVTQIRSVMDALDQMEKEFLEPPKEVTPKEMGAVPGEQITGEVPAERPVEEAEVIPTPYFASMDEAVEAGREASEEEVAEWRDLRQERLDEAEFFTGISKHKEAMAATIEATKYARAIEAFEEPERFVPPEKEAVTPALKLEEVPVVAKSYEEGIPQSKPRQNILVQPNKERGRVLFAQIGTSATATTEESEVAASYFDKLYTAREGYQRPADFWEIPTWIPITAKSLKDSDMLVVRDPVTAAAQIKDGGYEAVLFSSMDVNRHVIKQIAELVGPGTRIIVGGYADRAYFKGTPNIEFHETLDSAVESLGQKKVAGVDTKHFKGTATIPRLCMSKGCLHKCAFCTVPKGVSAESKESIDEQIDNMKGLKFKLVYLDDKTFGQAENFGNLTEISQRIRKFNPEFQGFVVQTTAPQLLKMSDEFLQESGIKFVELGVESYNDDILAKIHKPARTKTIDAAVEKLRVNKIAFIPNILVGLTGKGWSETKESYLNTLKFLKKNEDIISHVNVYNLALYQGTELANELESREDIDINENAVARSYHKNPKLHETFYRAVLKFGERQLDKVPFAEVPEVEAKLKKAETAQLGMFVEKKKVERGKVAQWVQKTEEEIVDEETGIKSKAIVLTPEAETALNKAGVKTGSGPFVTGSNFLVSLTGDKRGGVIYGKARSTDKTTTRSKDLLGGTETITEHWRTIGGKEFKVLDTPIMPKTKPARVKLMDQLLDDFKKEVNWYVNWQEVMARLVGEKVDHEKVQKLMKIQTILSAGSSPAGAQTAFGKAMKALEEFGSVRGGEGYGFTQDMAKKINAVWRGEDKNIQTLEDMQKAYGKKIGAMMFAALHPLSHEGAVVVDRHIARLWGYNAMWGGSFRVPKWLQIKITEDIVETAKRHDLPVPAVQAALWYASGAGHWGSATHFEEAIQMSPKSALSMGLMDLITLEPQSIVSFRGHLYYSIRGAQKAQPLTSTESDRLQELLAKASYINPLVRMSQEERDELLSLQHKKEGDNPSPWSVTDVQKRMDAETPDNKYVPLGYWYGPGVRRESFFWGKEPHLTVIHHGEIYDAVEDRLGYMALARERVQKDPMVVAGKRNPSDMLMNALAGVIRKAGDRDFKGFSLERNGNTWVFTFDEMRVEEHPSEVTVGLSDKVSQIVKLPDNLADLSKVSADPINKFADFVELKLKDYPISIQKIYPTFARLGDSTFGETEYGLSLKLKGPITAIRAALSDIVGLQKKQNNIILFHERRTPNGDLIRFTLKDEDLSKINKQLKKVEIFDFSIKKAGEKWQVEFFISYDNENASTLLDKYVGLYEKYGVRDSLSNTPIHAEMLTQEVTNEEPGYETDYKSHIDKYFGKKKGADVYAKGQAAGDEWAATSYLLYSTEAARVGVKGGEDAGERGVRDQFRDPETERDDYQAQLGPTERTVIRVRDSYGRSSEVSVLINPSLNRLRGLMNRGTYQAARILIGPDGTLYAWDAADAIHADIAYHFKFKYQEGLAYEIHDEVWNWTVAKMARDVAERFPKLQALLAGAEQAVGAPTGALATAQTMTTQGKSVEEIWRATGWIKGAEGKWRFEIDDTPSTIAYAREWKDRALEPKDPKAREGWVSPVRLEQILDHPELYRHYPQLRDIQVKVVRAEASAYYDIVRKILVVPTNRFTGGDDAYVASIYHEVQHAIQDIEGFALGSSPELEREILLQEDPAYKTYSIRKQKQIAERKYNWNAGEIEADDVNERIATLTTAERKKVLPYARKRWADMPMDKWIIRDKSSFAFSIDTTKAPQKPGVTAQRYMEGYGKFTEFTSLIRKALKESGLAQYPEILKKIELVTKSFIAPPPQFLTTTSMQEHAAKLKMSIAEVQAKLESGELGFAGLTDWSDPFIAVINIALNMNRTRPAMLDTLWHEQWHIIERWLLPTEVLETLKKFEPKREARAVKFAEYLAGREGAKPVPSQVRQFFDKFVDFLQRVRAFLFGYNFTSAEQVFEWARRGVWTPHFGKPYLEHKELRFFAALDTINEVESLSRESGRFSSVTDPVTDPLFDSEQVARKRVKEVVDNWMAPEALEASLKEDSWTPTPGQAPVEADVTQPSIIELPEMVEIYKLLTGGQIPGVREKLFGRESIRGVFMPGKGNIRLKADIFKDPRMAARVLAHEIGHLVDWLPDHQISGNILGKIASIRRFVEDTLPFKPGAPGALTDADIIRLREEAIKLLGMTQVLRTKWIDTTITTELKVTAEDLLNIWNAVEKAKLFSPELYKYVAGLSAEAKKMIAKAALKGMVPLEVEQFAKTVKGAKTRTQVTEVEYIPPTKKDIAKKVAELIEKEIRTRKLWVEQEVRDELKTLSMRWRPFDPAASSKGFINYRWSSAELYADAISVLFNDPQFLRAQAPRFYEAFFNYLETKPEVKRTYLEIQRQIHSGLVDVQRTQNIYRMFDEGNEAYAKAFEDMAPNIPDSMKRAFFDAFHFILKDVRKVGEGNIAVHDNPRYKLEKMVYTGSEIEALLTDLYANVIKPLEKANLKWDRQFGLATMLRRIIHDRDKMANPAGWDMEKAMNKLEAMKNVELTPTQWDALKLALQNFRTLHERYFIDKAAAAEIYDDAMIKRFRDNTTYATWDVMPYLVERYGHAVATRVYKQVGTLQDIPNPATATIMKDIAFIKAANKNIATRTVVKFYQDYANILGIEIKEAPKKWNGRYREIQEPKDPHLGLVVYLYKGKAYGYHLPKEIADAINENHTQYTMTARAFRWLAQPFRKIFTELNYGFWIFNAFFRDAQRLVMALPGYRVDKFAKHWLSGLKPAFKSVFGIPDATIQAMQRGNMLISVADYHGLNDEEQQVEKLLKMYHMKAPTVYQNRIMKPFGHLFNFISNRARLAEYYFTGVGRALERTTKVGAYTYLKEKFPNMPNDVIGHIVRTRGGSPDFLRAGKEQQLYNNILLFSNAMKEGYRGDVEAFKENPGEFMIKKTAFVLIPKLLMWAGLLGFLGAAVKDIFEGVSEYDLTNYLIIPLGRTKNGKSVYWRIPTDETSRFLGGIIWKILRAPEMGLTNQATQLFDYMAGQAPTMSPGISIIGDVVDYASGKNPYDHFYGRHAIGQVEFAAGDRRAHLQFLQYLLSKMGASIVYKFKHDKVEKVAEELESILGFPVSSKVADFVVESPDAPVVSNILGRFLKISDYGVRETILREKEEVKRENARNILDAREAAYALVDGESLTNAQIMALAQKPDVVQRQIMLALGRKYGMVYFEEWMAAGTTAEKMAVIRVMLEKNALANQDVADVASPEPARALPAPKPESEYPPLSIQEMLEGGNK